MKNILARSHRTILEQFAWSNVMLAFDYDGTLAPIVDDPDDARLRASTRELLESVSKRYPCVIISGRAQSDVLKRLRGTGVFEVIGNHGIEPWKYTEPFAARVRDWVPLLQKSLGDVKGVVIEDKGFSLAVHYRKSREKKRAKEAILRAAEDLEGVRIVGGKLVFNLLPEGAPHKGIALRAARSRLGCDTALYVGDDETDEDVFALDEPGRLLSIRVEACEESRAPYFIPAQPEIDTLLEVLASCRKGQGASP